MSGRNFIIAHILQAIVKCDNISAIHISNNNAGGILLEIVLDASASLNDAIYISNAMNNHGDYYIVDNVLTLYCHVLPNGIISNKAQL